MFKWPRPNYFEIELPYFPVIYIFSWVALKPKIEGSDVIIIFNTALKSKILGFSNASKPGK